MSGTRASVTLRAVCVYAGSYPGGGERYARAARGLARVLAERGLDLVFGGGRLGLMGVLADAALAHGVRVTGVIPRPLAHHEIARLDRARLRVVATMSERKALMSALADAFVALPGGVGTLTEVLDALTHTQLGLHRKPVGLLDVDHYWAALERQLDHAAREGFVTPSAREQLLVASNPGALLDGLASWSPPVTDPRVGHQGARTARALA